MCDSSDHLTPQLLEKPDEMQMENQKAPQKFIGKEIRLTEFPNGFNSETLDPWKALQLSETHIGDKCKCCDKKIEQLADAIFVQVGEFRDVMSGDLIASMQGKEDVSDAITQAFIWNKPPLVDRRTFGFAYLRDAPEASVPYDGKTRPPESVIKAYFGAEGNAFHFEFEEGEFLWKVHSTGGNDTVTYLNFDRWSNRMGLEKQLLSKLAQQSQKIVRNKHITGSELYDVLDCSERNPYDYDKNFRLVHKNNTTFEHHFGYLEPSVGYTSIFRSLAVVRTLDIKCYLRRELPSVN